jgi:transposase
MEILAAFDLTGSQRAAAELAGCSHHTVAAHVAARDAGRPVGIPVRRPQVTDPFWDKIEEWVEVSRGNIRADKVHEKLIVLGYAGSERSTRRAVAEVKKTYRLGHARVHRPWITEPGLWLQYDFGDGPVVATSSGPVKTVLFVAWLAWSRFRVVIALRDKTQPSVIAALDRTFRLLGGVPTYVLTDNEKTVTVEHIAGVPVRNAEAVSFGRHYGTTVLTCAPADPASKGGVEAAVKISKSRPGADRHKPPQRLRLFRRPRAGVRGVHGHGQPPDASGDPPGTGRHAGRGTSPAAPSPDRTAHGGVRVGPPGAAEHADDHLRPRPVLGAATAAW